MKHRNTWHRALLSGCLLFEWAGCATINPHPSRTVLAQDLVELPTFQTGNLLFVDVRLNGFGPYRFLVDTGGTGVAIASDVAQAAGLKSVAANAILYTPVAKLNEQAVHVDALESGGMKMEGLVAVLLQPSEIAALRRDLGEFDGILGIAVFKDVVLLMDFPRHQVSVARPGSQSYPEERAAAYTNGLDLCPQVTIDVCGKPVPALIDTGSGFCLIVPDLASYPLVGPIIKDDGTGGFGVGSSTGNRGENSQLAGTIRLGPVTWIDPPVRWQRDGRRANIGVLALDQWKLAFDQRSQIVYFLGTHPDREWQKQKQPDLRFRPGYLANPEGTSLRLIEVDRGGAFYAAGLRPGDSILSIDGLPAADFIKLNDFGGAARRIMRVERNRAIFQAIVTLQPAGPPK